MRNLLDYVQQGITMLEGIGIHCGNIVEIEANSRATSRWGQCKTIQYDEDWNKRTYKISISVILLDERNSEDGLMNTILHELLHSCEGCHGHTGEWKRLAAKVNRELGYNIKRTSSSEEKGVKFDTRKKPNQSSVPKFFVECSQCGLVYGRMKRTKVIQHPGQYRCGRCGGKLRHISN
jgi:predicted SprT family Zn-dependent metalloprotease